MKIIFLFISLIFCGQELWAAPIIISPSANEYNFVESEAKARNFFLESVKQSLKNLQETEKPIQVDLYIVIHFLMYNDLLHFADAAESSKITADIIKYVERQQNNDLFFEGCIMSKLLIALSHDKNYLTLEEKFAEKYFTFIKNQWPAGGVGECFVPMISRSYGNDMPERYCTPPTQELETKLAYYLAIDKSGDQEARFTFSTINKIMFGKIDDWSKATIELWVIDTYLFENPHNISKERYWHAVKLVEDAINSPQDNTLTMSLLAHAYLLSHQHPNEAVLQMLNKVAKTQDARGAIPSPMKNNTKTGHNFDASPTYIYLLALQALKAKVF